MRKGNKKSAKGKGVVVTAADRVFVGLDVHKRQIHAAVRVNGQEVGTHVLPTRPAAVAKFVARYGAGLKHVVCEARPTFCKNERREARWLMAGPSYPPPAHSQPDRPVGVSRSCRSPAGSPPAPR